MPGSIIGSASPSTPLSKRKTSGIISNENSHTGSLSPLFSRSHQLNLHKRSTSSQTNELPLPDHTDSSNYEENTVMRHGFEDEYNSDAYMSLLAQIFYIYFDDKRHTTAGNPSPFVSDDPTLPEWRMKYRQKTVSAAIVLCLNIGVDPPDVVKTQPCAKLEAWVDPTAFNDPKKATEQIGKQLQTQYETLSLRTRYKQSLDPNVEDAKRFCVGLRRAAKDERILFHYNGHGVPKPTASGEIWVFNRGYTQYIPVSLYDLQSWLGAPCLFVYDCHAAGHIVNNFNRFVQKRIEEDAQKATQSPSSSNNTATHSTVSGSAYLECIQLAACQANETLPMNPDLPADLFTCCLTSPIEIAIRWFVLQSPLPIDLSLNISIPGRLADRRTPLGELNWIFTAITDTIAWSLLPRNLFKRLFRQDLMVAALFRNFLLAERIMRTYSCHVISEPPLPKTYNHPMWDSWDLAVDKCLSQLPMLMAAEKEGGPHYEYKRSTFFEEQLTAFEVWLKYGSNTKKPPDQLPVVLQVLLSQVHRLRALILLSKYLDLGPWAVYSALSIGIFPYVLKLLQSPAQELKPVLVFIWARIMSVDYKNIQLELLKDNGYLYFINILAPREGLPISNINISEHRAMCAFVIALFCHGCPTTQRVCIGPDVISACMVHMDEPENPLLRQWVTLCISSLWDENDEAKYMAVKLNAPERICRLLSDPIPEVRTASVQALTTFLGESLDNIKEDTMHLEINIAINIMSLIGDGSSIVRREVVVFFSKFVKRYASKFCVAMYDQLEVEVGIIKDPSTIRAIRSSCLSYNTPFSGILKALLMLSVDPFQEVVDYAEMVNDWLLIRLLESPLGEFAKENIEFILKKSRPNNEQNELRLSESSFFSKPRTAPKISRNFSETYLSSTLRRSVSIATSIKNFAFRNGQPSTISNSTMYANSGNNASTYSNSLGRGSNASSESGLLGTTGSFPLRKSAGVGLDLDDSTPSVTTVPYGVGIKPQTPRYEPPRIKEDQNAEKTDKKKEGSGENKTGNSKEHTNKEKISLPLSSNFFEWSCEYFQEPQMSHPEMDEPGSLDYSTRLWRRNRNEHIIAETQPQKELAVSGNWQSQVGVLNNYTQPKKILFAQFEPHLVSIDDRDGVAVWDWMKSKRLNRFCNSNPVGTKVTEVKFINEDDVPLLLTGAGDGVVRLYRNYENKEKIELVSAWRALTDMLPSNKSSGLVAEWQQGRGTLLVGGDVKVIRVWDAPRELCMVDIPARSGSPITSLTSDQVTGNIFVCGFGDGAMRVYDRRLNARDAMVKVWKAHSSWVLDTHMQRGGYRELYSASIDGRVNLWDIRLDSPVVTFQGHGRGMRASCLHEHAPLIATGGQGIRVWTTAGRPTAYLKGYSGILQNRNSTVSTIAFHPHRMIMAANNAQDSRITLYNASTNLKHEIKGIV